MYAEGRGFMLPNYAVAKWMPGRLGDGPMYCRMVSIAQ